ncbi:MAG: hypothetical protein B6243_13335 [Anaerolineaceae bacterium 4572_5.2]|nr:MAG: hypothetical protein B6243_13335 [Anaerolineaceae bacterium 4572_5.2]
MIKFWLLLPISLFLAFTLYQIDLPGLHYDEAFEIVPAMQLLKGQPVNAFRESALTLFSKEFPLMTQDYIGALNTCGSVPFLLIGGATVAALRSYAIAIGLLTLLLVYGFTTELSGRSLAGLAGRRLELASLATAARFSLRPAGRVSLWIGALRQTPLCVAHCRPLFGAGAVQFKIQNLC